MDPNYNKNLIQQAHTADKESLRSILDRFREIYHNDVGAISDQLYDELVDIYEERFGEYEPIGALPRGEGVSLQTYRGGMRKMSKEDEINLFAKNYNGDYILMDKVDGSNMEYVLNILPNGERIEKLYTRGSGDVGEDKSHLIPYLNIPKLNFNIDVVGEVYVTKESFNRVGRSYFDSNERGMASGTINRKSDDPDLPVLAPELKFKAFRVVGTTATPEEQILWLKSAGFNVPFAIKSPKISLQLLKDLHDQRKATNENPIDGIAVYKNISIPFPTDKRPEHIRAFKIKEESFETTVTLVEWNAGYDRVLNPRIHYETVVWKDGEANLNHTSGFNARYIVDNGIGPGAKIMITRSNDILPHITSVTKKVEPSLPDPNVHGVYNWDENQVRFVLSQDNRQVRMSQIERFRVKLGIDDFGEERIMAMINAGFFTLQSILTASPQQFAAILGPTNGPKIYTEIHTKIKNVPLAKLMAASGIFYNIGEKRFKKIIAKYPQFHLWWKQDPLLIAQALQEVEGIKTLAYTIAQNMSAFSDWLVMHPMITIAQPSLLVFDESAPQEEKTLAGQVIVFSGIRADTLGITDKIEARGGVIGSGVTGKTTILVVENLNNLTTKVRNAQAKGTKIMQLEDFKRQYLS